MEVHQFGLSEAVWKKVKKDGTHLRYFPQFCDLVSRVDHTLANLARKPHELTSLAGEYQELMSIAA